MIGQTNAAQGLGGLSQYQGAGNAVYAPPTVAPPRTIASAISRMEGVNDRLGKVNAMLDGVASALGALRSVSPKGVGEKPAAAGAIHRLNDSADAAHSQLADIEELLAAISGALG